MGLFASPLLADSKSSASQPAVDIREQFQPNAPRRAPAVDMSGTWVNRAVGVTVTLRRDGANYSGSFTIASPDGRAPISGKLDPGGIDETGITMSYQHPNGNQMLFDFEMQGDFLNMTIGDQTIVMERVGGAAPQQPQQPPQQPQRPQVNNNGPFGPGPGPNVNNNGPAAGIDARWNASYSGDGLTVRFAPLPDNSGVVGVMEFGGKRYGIEGRVNGDRVDGAFFDPNQQNGDRFPFVATLAADGVSFASGGSTYNLKGQAAPAPQNNNVNNPLAGNNNNVRPQQPVQPQQPQQPQKPAVDGLPAEVAGDFGIELDFNNPEGVIKTVVPGSPADGAGFAVGDQVIEVNGEPINGKTFNQVHAALRGRVGSMVTVAVRGKNGANKMFAGPRQRMDLCQMLHDNPIKDFATHESPTGLFSVEHPAAWKVNTAPDGFMIDSGTLGFRAGVAVRDADGAADGKAVFEKFIKATLPPDAKVTESREVPADVHGVAGYVVEFETTNPKTGFSSTVVIFTTVTQGKALVATTMTAEWCPSGLDEVVQRVQNSLKIKA
jgi:membrane-associated protease RseP (regulator of RpoE activity)